MSLVLTVGVIAFDDALIGGITVVVDEEFFADINKTQGAEEDFLGGIDEVVLHVGGVRMIIQAAVTQQQGAVAFRPLEAVAVEDRVFKSGVVAMIDENNRAALQNFILFDVTGSDETANVEGG